MNETGINKRALPVLIVSALAIGGAVLTGCSSGSGTSSVAPNFALPATSTPSPTAVPVSASGRYKDLVSTVTAPKQVYAKGETVPLTVTVQNTGNIDHRLAFLLGVSSDFAVQGVLYSATGEMMGLITKDPTTPSEYGKSYLYPAGTTTTAEVVSWDQTYTPGYLGETVTPLAAGTYRLRLFVRAYSYDRTDLPGGDLSTDYLNIEIR